MIGGLLALLVGGRRRAGEKYAGPAHPAMSAGGAKPKKLVLTVIDAMKPAMLERAVDDGPRAGAEAADRAAARWSTTASRRSPR